MRTSNAPHLHQRQPVQFIDALPLAFDDQLFTLDLSEVNPIAESTEVETLNTMEPDFKAHKPEPRKPRRIIHARDIRHQYHKENGALAVCSPTRVYHRYPQMMARLTISHWYPYMTMATETNLISVQGE